MTTFYTGICNYSMRCSCCFYHHSFQPIPGSIQTNMIDVFKNTQHSSKPRQSGSGRWGKVDPIALITRLTVLCTLYAIHEISQIHA